MKNRYISKLLALIMVMLTLMPVLSGVGTITDINLFLEEQGTHVHSYYTGEALDNPIYKVITPVVNTYLAGNEQLIDVSEYGTDLVVELYDGLDLKDSASSEDIIREETITIKDNLDTVQMKGTETLAVDLHSLRESAAVDETLFEKVTSLFVEENKTIEFVSVSLYDDEGESKTISISEENEIIHVDVKGILKRGEYQLVVRSTYHERTYTDVVHIAVDGILLDNGRTLIKEQWNDESLFELYDSSQVKVNVEEKAIDRHTLEIKPKKGPINSMLIRTNDLSELPYDFIGIDEKVDDLITINGDRIKQTYAIDPSQANITNITLNITAKGSVLYKCVEWDFTSQTCNGEWDVLRSIVPGETYTITIDAVDPGFGEGDGESLSDTCTFSDQSGQGDGDSGVNCQAEINANNGGFTADLDDLETTGTTAQLDANYANSLLVQSINGVNVSIRYQRQTNTNVGATTASIQVFDTGAYVTACTDTVTIGAWETYVCDLSAYITTEAELNNIDIRILMDTVKSGSPKQSGKTFIDYMYITANFVETDVEAPTYSTIETNIASPTTYNPGTLYNFNTTWNDNIALDTVVIEHNFSGTLTNYTPTVSGSIYNYTAELGVGTYSWKYYANDTSGNSNNTPSQTFTVNKANTGLILELNESSANITTENSDTINLTVTSNGEGTHEILRDGSSIASGNSPLTQLEVFNTVGSYNITARYNSTENYTASSATYFVTLIDTIPPGVVSGLANQSSGDSWIYWTWANPVDTDFDHVEVWINGTFRENTTATNINVTGLSANTEYEIQVRSADIYDNVGSFTNDLGKTLTSLDTTPPIISNVINYSITEMSAIINWTTDEVANSRVKYGTSSGTYPFEEFDALNVLSHSSILSGLDPGTTYYYVVNSTDIASNSAQDGEYTFTTLADTKAPTWSVLTSEPSSPTTYSGTTSEFNSTWNDNVNVDSVVIEHNFSGTLFNYTPSQSGSVYSYTYTLPAGSYVWRYYANDTSGNSNTTAQFVYTVNKATPTMTLELNELDANISVDEDTSVNVTGTMSMPSGNLDLRRNGTLIDQNTDLVNDISSYQPGIYEFSSQYAGNENYTARTILKTLTVNDVTTPNVTLVSPTDLSEDKDSTVVFSYTNEDNVEVSSCNIYIDDVFNQSDNNITPSDSFTITTFVNGNYLWIVECQDAAGNYKNSTTWQINISIDPPVEIGTVPISISAWDDANAITLSDINATDANNENRAIAKNTIRQIDWINFSANVPLGSTITDATFYVRHLGNTRTTFEGINWYNGSSYIGTGCAPVTQTGAYRTDSCSLASYVDTVEKANNLSLEYIVSAANQGNGGNIQIDHIYVNISYLPELTPPVITITNITIDSDETVGEQIIASDANGIESYSVNDTVQFSINNSGYLSNITTLGLGTHLVDITANDPSGNSKTESMQIEVKELADINITSDDGITIYNSTGGTVLVGSGEINERLELGQLYEVEFETTSFYGIQKTRLHGVNISQNLNATTQYNDSYTGGLPINIPELSTIFALDEATINYTYAAITLPKAGVEIEYITHCLDWNFTTQECSTWEVNETADYEYNENSTHMFFNVSQFDAFGGGPGDTLPNLTLISVYDVTAEADKTTGGTLVHSGVNTTFNLISQNSYRVEFNVTNEAKKWILAGADVATHSGLNESWTVENITYNIGGTDYIGGTFNSGIVSWDLSLGGTMNANTEATWFYVVNTTGGKAKNYNVDWLINDTSKDSGSTDNSNFTMLPALDIVVNSSSVTLSDLTPIEGENINITLELYNIGAQNSSNFTVQLYDETTLLFNTSINITTQSSWQYNYTWTTTIGEHNFSLQADTPVATNGVLSEDDETNNQYDLELNVSSWHTFYGDVYKTIILGTNNNNKVHEWAQTVTSGSIYFADSDAIINFNTLQALGRNDVGGASSNDFLEADQTLNMVNVYDNVTSRFASDISTPLQTRSYESYAGTITSVPYINTTAAGNFTTGIVWDTSNSTNSEYDNGETLIFITEVNMNKDGAYGTYDYEITVPTQLQTSTGVMDTMNVYMELN